ncbi:MAG: adenosylmethionine--8-amino-7-oxononanoate transaminase [Chitinophagaceae bacterium]|nr:adenosylmethionine--8-amino-7-oxononanoate transaminase [Chitinophagaceae bacterium]
MGSSLTERDKKVIWHPYSPQKYAPEPIPVVKGHGSWIFDENGRRYLDAISSWWVTIHGHAHPYIAGKIYRQALELEQVIFAGFTHAPAVNLAEKLLGILPGNFSKIFYSDNGSTAVEVAIKMATQFWWNKGEKKRNRILAFNHSYHGDTFGAMSVSERGLFTLAFHDRLFEVNFVDPPRIGVKQDISSLLEQCVCVIYEPLLQGAGGMNVYDAKALDEFIALCRSHGVICIADEVMTGFGRTGKMFASENCVNKPDIICLSKGLTGGTMAMGVTACSKLIHDAFVTDDKKKTFFHGHSFTANPLSCAAALASLDLFKIENTFQHIGRIVRSHESFAARLAGYRNIKNIRQCGTIIAFEIPDEVSGYTSSIRDVITASGLENGVYLRPLGNTVYLMPPYCMSEEEMERVYEVVLEICTK